VKYDADKTNPENISKAIADMGYKVDEPCKKGTDCCKVNGGVCKEKNKMGKTCTEKDKLDAKNGKGSCESNTSKTKNVK
jgi:hypothetical protein